MCAGGQSIKCVIDDHLPEKDVAAIFGHTSHNLFIAGMFTLFN